MLFESVKAFVILLGLLKSNFDNLNIVQSLDYENSLCFFDSVDLPSTSLCNFIALC